jgi:hypothetical protein
MSETQTPESQSERRVKYGTLVGVTIVVAILLASAVVAMAERKPKRVDTTASGMYSLKPQTINIITGNTQKVHITSLYTKAKSAEEQQATQQGTTTNAPDVGDQADKINDLLEEYRSKGKNIEVDAIDPIANPTKISDLISEVTDKYGGQVNKYRQFVGTDKEPGTYSKSFKDLQDAMDAQMKALVALPMGQVKSPELLEAFQEVHSAMRGSIADLKQAPEQLKREYLREKPPLFKKAADRIKEVADDTSSKMQAIVDYFTKLKGTKEIKTLPEPIQKYVADSIATYGGIKKQADDLSKQATDLGELKLDTLSDALRQKNAILVRGENDWKVIPYDQVWKREVGQRPGATDTKSTVRFAGEQMITAAIWSLSHPQKLKVAFVRAGGQPVTQAGFPPFMPAGTYADVAESLRQYNYDVVDKDLTGAAQMQQQQMGPPEPSEEEIRDAVWVVLDVPSGGGQFGQQSPTISPKVADHLNHGGSALFLLAPQGDDMAIALKNWGIELKTNAVIVHEEIKAEGAHLSELEMILRLPFLFPIREWGDSPVTAPLRTLPGVLIGGVPVNRTDVKGVKSWSILPVPTDQKIWGETDINSVNAGATYNPDKGDLAPPLYSGAVAEKEGKGRVVVIGSSAMPNNGVMRYRDAEGNVRGAAFPGNSEVFMDSVFWLSHQEPMIAISPAAMDVSRIEPMSTTAQNAWRGGVLLVLLPALAIGLGALVFVARRD